MQTNQTSRWYVQSKACCNAGIAGSNSAQDITYDCVFLCLCGPVQVERRTNPGPRNSNKCLYVIYVIFWKSHKQEA